MKIVKLFLSFEGRIGRLQFWIGIIAVELLALAIEWAFGIPIGTEPSALRPRVIEFVIQFIAMYPEAAIAVKRLHDRDRPGNYVLPLVAAAAVILIGDLFGYFNADLEHMSVAEGAVLLAAGVIGLTFLVELGFRAGTQGANRYGPDPRQSGVDSSS
jgi:uncharacterized membrane protein YhaH (DUF805 family)